MLLGKHYDNAFKLSMVIRQYIVVSFPEAVRDNVVSNDVTITSSLRSGVIILGKKYYFLRKMSHPSGWFMPKITKLCLHFLKLCREKYDLFFWTRCTEHFYSQVTE